MLQRARVLSSKLRAIKLSQVKRHLTGSKLKQVNWSRLARRVLPRLLVLWIFYHVLRDTEYILGKGSDEDGDGSNITAGGKEIYDKGGLYLSGHMWCYHQKSFNENIAREEGEDYDPLKSGDCMCEAGWNGPTCNTPECDQCIHGKCLRPQKCQCSNGWEGKGCEKPICRQKCVHGECNTPNKCKCQAGWAGSACTVRCEHGTYKGEKEREAGAPQVSCVCDKGWHGTACTKATCSRYGCVHGVCAQPDVCICDAGWAGQDCTTDLVLPHVKTLLKMLTPAEHPFESVVMNRHSEPEAWTHLKQYSSQLVQADPERIAQKWKLVDYVPGNDTLKNWPTQSQVQHNSVYARHGAAGPRGPRWKRCAVVGDSSGLLSTQLGQLIDKHDAVLRFNFAPTARFEDHVGKKTTLRLLNLKSTMGILQRNGVRFIDKGKSSSRRPNMVMWRPEVYYLYPQVRRRFPDDQEQLMRVDFLQHVLDIYYGAYERFKRTGTVTADKIEAKDGHGMVDATSEEAAARVPSSFVGVVLMLHLCGHVNLFGFDPPSVQHRVRDLGIVAPTYYSESKDFKEVVAFSAEDGPLGYNVSAPAGKVWRGLAAEKFPGAGGALGGGQYDQLLLRLLELYGLLNICTTTAPERCLDTVKV